jgi:hypothetical protein
MPKPVKPVSFLNKELTAAVSACNLKQCMKLVGAGADYRLADENGLTFMLAAACSLEFEAVEWVFSLPQFDWKSADAQAALTLLTASQKLGMLETAARLGADFRFVLPPVSVIALRSHTHLNVQPGEDTLLSLAVQTVNTGLVRFFLDRGLKPDYRPGTSEYPIFKLIKAMPRSRFGRALPQDRELAKSFHKRAFETLKLLVERGARLDVESRYFNTPLIEAVATGIPYEAIKYLAGKGAEVNARGIHGTTALIACTRSNADPGAAAVLIGCGADPCVKDDFGNTAMHLAVICSNARYLSELLKACKNVDVINRAGLTPLMIAAERGEADKVRLLVSAGANPEIKDKSGKTAFKYAKTGEIRSLLETHSQAESA